MRLRWHRLFTGACVLGWMQVAVGAVPAQPRDDAEVQVNTYVTSEQRYPAVAIAPDGSSVIAWASDEQDGGFFGIYAQRYAPDGTPRGTEFRVNVITDGSETEPSVAMDSAGNFVICWEQSAGDNYIHARGYAADGTPLSQEFLVNDEPAAGQDSPVLHDVDVAAAPDGSFVAVWSRHQQGAPDRIMGRRFSKEGAKLGAEFAAYVTGGETQWRPRIAISGSGDMLIVWSDVSENIVRARSYSPALVPLGDAFSVAQGACGTEGYADVATNEVGDFAVAWDCSGPVEVYARRFSPGGVPQGPEFALSTGATSDPSDVAVGVDAEGTATFVWQANGAYRAVYAQQFALDGQVVSDKPLGSEFPVNVEPTGYEEEAAIAVSASGDWVAAWANRDADDYGVFARFYAAAAAQAVPTVSIEVAPQTIVLGDIASLSWSSGGAASCTASGAWSGSQATSGMRSVSPTGAGVYTYTLTCANAVGQASASASLTVEAAGGDGDGGSDNEEGDGGGGFGVLSLVLLVLALGARQYSRRPR